jgi:NAD(P)-dependent dehydrogenase (short-subunit alcohol dehydrogenase family)
MADCIKGKVYIITGSAGGLGKAFAEQLLMRGAKVCISDIQVNSFRNSMRLAAEQVTVP